MGSRVYVLVDCCDYEGGEVDGIFATLDEAERALAEPIDGDFCELYEWELGARTGRLIATRRRKGERVPHGK